MPRKESAPTDVSASKLIDQRVKDLGDWRGKVLQRMRELIHQIEPKVQEEWKWRGTPVWSHEGGICTGESYKQSIKLTFHHGASLPDPTRMFTSSLEGNVRRALDILQEDKINEAAFKKLVRAAIDYNLGKKTRTKKAPTKEAAQATAAKKAARKPAAKKPAPKKPATAPKKKIKQKK